MAAGQYDDLIIEQGATFIFEVGWFDTNGDLRDLSDFDARMQVRKVHKSPDPILSMSVSGGEITLYDDSGAGGLGTINIRVEVDDAVTEAIVERDLGACVWDLELEDNGGAVFRVLEGKAVISPEVTR